jgi:hypothetical protein
MFRCLGLAGLDAPDPPESAYYRDDHDQLKCSEAAASLGKRSSCDATEHSDSKYVSGRAGSPRHRDGSKAPGQGRRCRGPV